MQSIPIKSEILDIRVAVRVHRDQVGDYRCWVDDQVLYHRVLPELKGVDPVLPNQADFHRQCELYFEHRQNPQEPVCEIPLDSSVGPLVLTYGPELDADLEGATPAELTEEVQRWYNLIRQHRDAGDRRTFEHDRAMYMNLPEKREATTRLPPRESFLGRGCPSYNKFCQANPDQFSRAAWEK